MNLRKLGGRSVPGASHGGSSVSLGSGRAGTDVQRDPRPGHPRLGFPEQPFQRGLAAAARAGSGSTAAAPRLPAARGTAILPSPPERVTSPTRAASRSRYTAQREEST